MDNNVSGDRPAPRHPVFQDWDEVAATALFGTVIAIAAVMLVGSLAVYAAAWPFAAIGRATR